MLTRYQKATPPIVIDPKATVDDLVLTLMDHSPLFCILGYATKVRAARDVVMLARSFKKRGLVLTVTLTDRKRVLA